MIGGDAEDEDGIDREVRGACDGCGRGGTDGVVVVVAVIVDDGGSCILLFPKPKNEVDVLLSASFVFNAIFGGTYVPFNLYA